MFKIGDYVFDKNTNDRVQIVDVSTVWDFVSYKVFNPVTGAVYKLSGDAVEAESRQVNANEYYLRYVAMLSKIKSETSEGILSKLSSGVIPLPHQLHVLNRAVSDNNVRYILADEVGLGNDSRFLEPTCGEENFLVEILSRKLSVVTKKYKASYYD